MFCLDVVAADWAGFATGGSFDLGNPNALQASVSDYWNRLFEKIVPPLDPYDDAPIYRVEITSSRGDPWFDQLLTLDEEEWVLVVLDHTGPFEVDVYGSLLGAAVTARLVRIERNIPESAALNVAFSPNTWPDATEPQLRSALAGLPRLEYLIGLDVGQGTAVGLADANENIHLYFDLGGGVYRREDQAQSPNVLLAGRRPDCSQPLGLRSLGGRNHRPSGPAPDVDRSTPIDDQEAPSLREQDPSRRSEPADLGIVTVLNFRCGDRRPDARTETLYPGQAQGSKRFWNRRHRGRSFYKQPMAADGRCWI